MEPFVCALVLSYLTCPSSEPTFSLGDRQGEIGVAQSSPASLSLESNFLDSDARSRTQ